MAKRATAKKSTTTRARRPSTNEVDAAVDAGKADATMNVQSGMDPGPPSDRREQQVRDQFATADELAAPTEKERREIEDARVAREVRPF